VGHKASIFFPPLRGGVGFTKGRVSPERKYKEENLMPDYKAMYYHLAGRMATAVEALEATTTALATISAKLKQAQQATEDMFIECEDDEEENGK
jgi:hypothetical protein